MNNLPTELVSKKTIIILKKTKIEKLITTVLFIILFVKGSDSFCLEKFLVKSINFEGLEKIPLETAMLYVPIQNGETINSEKIRNTIRSLFSTGYFENIEMYQRTNSLLIKVKERPTICKISFYGNKIVRKEMLQKNLEIENIKVGAFFNERSLFRIKKNLENFYSIYGNYNIRIQTIVEKFPFNQVNIRFLFYEGKTARVQTINIFGNKTFSFARLVKHFRLYERDFWLGIKIKKRYHRERLFTDLKLLQNFYLNRGYAQFKIDSIHMNLTPDKENIYITLKITEGEKYKLSEIKFKDIPNFSSKIEEIIKNKLHTHEFYNKKKISTVENQITRLFEKNGYIFSKIIERNEIDKEKKTVRLYFDIRVGTRFLVNRIDFIGNQLTKDFILRREIKQIEGDWINILLVNQGKKNLIKLGYFETVDVEFRRVPNSSNRIDILYRVKEKKYGNINFGLDFDNESRLGVQLNVQQNNWLGTGKSFKIFGIKNSYQTYSEIEIDNPYFTNDKLSTSLKLFFNKFYDKSINVLDYKFCRYSVNTTTSFPIKNNEIISVSTSYSHDDLKNIEPQTIIWRYLKSIEKNFENKEEFGKENSLGSIKINDLLLSLGYNYNNLEKDNYFPNFGKNIELNGKITLPGSRNRYYKIVFNSNQYIPLNKNRKWISANRVSIGYMKGIKRKEAPFYQNFYVGGSENIRGFRSNTIGPKAFYCHKYRKGFFYECDFKKSNVSTGGNVLLLASTELTFPIASLNSKISKFVRTSFFIDGGTVWDSNWKKTKFDQLIKIPRYELKNIRISSGFSMKWISPIGPLVLSYAKAVKKFEGDQIESFQLNFGRNW